MKAALSLLWWKLHCISAHLIESGSKEAFNGS